MKNLFILLVACMVRTFIIANIITVFFSAHAAADTTEKDVSAAMKKAADFMTNTVSNRGGYVFMYKADLSAQWGEIPARKTQIWVQPPGTPTVGIMLLEAYRATGDSNYLAYAKRAANALIRGQHPSGGWHYLIDFDMPGIRKWYEEVASKCWGWEEYLHYYGNCTFDDESTTAPTRFLLELYMETLEPVYRVPLLKALDFILESQYPNGAWPQRYPLRYEHVHGDHPDYTSNYTFNDGVIRNNIDIFLEAWEKLGNEEYRKAAYRAMDFYIISQLPSPQAGWADQYDMNMKPAWARNFEPPAIASGQTARSIYNLELFYKITGDRKYLKPIPAAIEWLESAVINTDPSRTYTLRNTSRNYTHAYYYELGTNKPIYAHRSGTGIEDERFWLSYDFENMYPYGPPYVLNLEPIKKEFDRVNALSPEDAMAEYRAQKETRGKVPRIVRKHVEIGWDYIYGGLGAHYYVFDGPGRTREKQYDLKEGWANFELMIPLIFIVEYTGEHWAKEYYDKLYHYIIKTYDTDWGVWKQSVNRFGGPISRDLYIRKRWHPKRKGNFHQPRAMMYNMLSFDRMIHNKGKLTPFPV